MAAGITRPHLLAATHHFDGPLVRNADLLVAGDVQQLLAQLLQQRDCLLCPQARGEESAQQRPAPLALLSQVRHRVAHKPQRNMPTLSLQLMAGMCLTWAEA